jgi:hypothetical protein
MLTMLVLLGALYLYMVCALFYAVMFDMPIRIEDK